MLRRLFFLFPDVHHTRQVVDELRNVSVDQSRLHAMARPGIDLSMLPASTSQQKSDRVWFLEQLFWYGNLGLFALALTGLFISLYWGHPIWSLFAIVVVFATFIAGERFAVMLPHAHLDEVHGALAHGEILLMVDVPKQRIPEINELVLKHHPEAELGGVGWTVGALKGL